MKRLSSFVTVYIYIYSSFEGSTQVDLFSETEGLINIAILFCLTLCIQNQSYDVACNFWLQRLH